MPIAFGVTATGEMIPLLVDDNGQLLVVPKADSHVFSKLHGYYSGAWQKAPLPFGPSGSVARAWQNTSLAGGNQNVDDSAVPSGEAWVITNIGMTATGTAPTQLIYRVNSGGTDTNIMAYIPPTVSQFYDRQTWLVLFPTDFLRLYVVGGVAGKAVYGNAAGFRMDLDL